MRLSERVGALLRFVGEGVTAITRREMLGVHIAPTLSLNRIDVSAGFTATIPLSYLPRRKSWRPDAGFKLELLHFRESSASVNARWSAASSPATEMANAGSHGPLKAVTV